MKSSDGHTIQAAVTSMDAASVLAASIGQKTPDPAALALLFRSRALLRAAQGDLDAAIKKLRREVHA